MLYISTDTNSSFFRTGIQSITTLVGGNDADWAATEMTTPRDDLAIVTGRSSVRVVLTRFIYRTSPVVLDAPSGLTVTRNCTRSLGVCQLAGDGLSLTQKREGLMFFCLCCGGSDLRIEKTRLDIETPLGSCDTLVRCLGCRKAFIGVHIKLTCYEVIEGEWGEIELAIHRQSIPMRFLQAYSVTRHSDYQLNDDEEEEFGLTN